MDENLSMVNVQPRKKSAFCNICFNFLEKKSIGKTVFSAGGDGFSNWKKASQKLKDHNESDIHKYAERRKIVHEGEEPTISKRIDSMNEELKRKRREGLIAHLCTLKTVLRQGIAIRRVDDEESNLIQFNIDKANHVPGLKLLLKEKRFLSHDIVQEQESMLILKARRQLISKVSASNYFLIIADESADISKKEQLSVSFRTVSDRYEIMEDFIGVMHCSRGLSADALLDYVKDILLRCGLDKANLVGMGFDGPSVMKKLARDVKEYAGAQALYVHCLAHCTELIIKDAVEVSHLLSDALDLCQDLYAFVGAYPKRVLLFDEIQKEETELEISNRSISSFGSKPVNLKSLSQTRWTSRGRAAKVIIEKHAELRATLQEISEDRRNSRHVKAQAQGLEAKLSSYKMMFSIVSLYDIIVVMEKLSKELQAVDNSADYASYSIEKTVTKFHAIRSNEEYVHILHKVEKFGNLVQEEDQPSRKRKMPSRHSDFVVYAEGLGNTESTSTSSDQLKMKHFEALDAILEGINTRHSQTDIKLLKSMESMLLSAANREPHPVDDFTAVTEKYHAFFDQEILKEELEEIPFVIKMHNASAPQGSLIKRVTRVATLCDLLNGNESAKKSCSSVHELIKLYLSVPLSSATAERTFSVMRRCKTWLRAQTEGNHLNNIMFATIHKQLMDDIDVPKVASEFVGKTEQRRNYFGAFN